MPKPHRRPNLICAYCVAPYDGNTRTRYCSASCKVRHSVFIKHGKGYAPGDPRIRSAATYGGRIQRGVQR